MYWVVLLMFQIGGRWGGCWKVRRVLGGGVDIGRRGGYCVDLGGVLYRPIHAC